MAVKQQVRLKNRAAEGDPILAENLKLQTGSTDFKESTSFVQLFNETAAFNLMRKDINNNLF